jgi:hypothetical protein
VEPLRNVTVPAASAGLTVAVSVTDVPSTIVPPGVVASVVEVATAGAAS